MRLGNYLFLLVALFLASCAAPDIQHHIVISTRDQKLAVLDRGTLLTTYPVSTSKFGLGDYSRSSRTPLGELEVAKKIGDNAPLGAVFKDRIRTGDRKASELRMYSDALERHYSTVQHRRSGCGGDGRGRAAHQRSSRARFSSLNVAGKYRTICDALVVGTSLRCPDGAARRPYLRQSPEALPRR